MPNFSNTRRILFSVSGMSPQIITETLYTLMQQEPAWLPDEIHLLTTSEGKDRAQLQLLTDQQDGPGHFHRLLEEYGITRPIHFDSSTIHVIENREGKPLADLRTPEDNEAAADCILDKVRSFTADSNTELHVSIAGGRKTMGFYVGYALSLFGRPQDRLSHVLVSSDYESHPKFFYPTRVARVIYSKDEKPLDTSQAKVWMAEIPFVRLRHFLPNNNLLEQKGFSEVVQLVEVLAGNPTIELDLVESCLRVGSIRISLPPRECGLYLMFIRQLQCGHEAFVLPKGDSNNEMAQAYLEALRDTKGPFAEFEAQERALKKGMDRDYFDPLKSRLYKTLASVLGEKGAEKYMIKSGPRGTSTVFLDLDPELVSVKE